MLKKGGRDVVDLSEDELREIDRIYGAGAPTEQLEHLRSLLERQAGGLTKLATTVGMVAISELAPPMKARVFLVVAKALDNLMPQLDGLIKGSD